MIMSVKNAFMRIFEAEIVIHDVDKKHVSFLKVSCYIVSTVDINS